MDKCHPTKPCSSYCYNWFECCNHGKHYEKCYRWNKQNKPSKRQKKEVGKNDL